MHSQIKKGINEGIYSIGINSKLLEFIFNHPWLGSFVFIGILGIIFFNNNFNKWILSITIITSITLFITICMRIYHKNSCYRIELDDKEKKVKLFLLFNKGSVEFPINDINIVVKRNVYIYHDNKKYIVPSSIYQLVDMLPEETSIEFIGFWGKLAKKEMNLIKKAAIIVKKGQRY